MKKYIIPLFIPHYGCKYDCVFCNQKKITGQATPITPQEVADNIHMHLRRINKPRSIEVAYYGGSFTALPKDVQTKLLQPATELLKAGRIDAIRLSTRPDCITTDIVNHLVNMGVTTIELGVQSLDDQVLAASARGHRAQHVVEAVGILRQSNLMFGLQLMLGLPKETWASLIKTAVGILSLKPDFVRIYPTLVLANTRLAEFYQAGLYQPLTLEAAAAKAAYLKLLFEQQHIQVIRTGLQATEELNDSSVVLAGPYHPAFGEIVETKIFDLMFTKLIAGLPHLPPVVTLHHHLRDSSKIRGFANTNIVCWRRVFNLNGLKLIPDGCAVGEIAIDYEHTRLVINKNMLINI